MFEFTEERLRRGERADRARVLVIEAAKNLRAVALEPELNGAEVMNASHELCAAVEILEEIEAEYAPEKIENGAENQLRPRGACL